MFLSSQGNRLGWPVALAIACCGTGCGGADAEVVPVHPGGPTTGARGAASHRPADDIDDSAVAVSSNPDHTQGYPPTKPLTINAKMQQRCRQYRPLFERVSQASGLDTTLIMAIAWVESGFNPSIESPAGASGLMQLVPRTAEAFGCSDPSEPRCAVAAAANYLNRLLRQFDGQLMYALCAYHAGSFASLRAFRAGQLPNNLSYAERVLEARSRLDRDGCEVK